MLLLLLDLFQRQSRSVFPAVTCLPLASSLWKKSSSACGLDATDAASDVNPYDEEVLEAAYEYFGKPGLVRQQLLS
jgi:hypothetical protein